MNIAATLQDIAEKYGDAPGLIEAKTGKTLSFKELNDLSDGYAQYLHKNGVSSGDRVMLMVRPSADFICLTFALFKIGAPVILIDPGMGYKNLLRCIKRVQPKILIGLPQALIFAKIYRKNFSSVHHFFCCGKSFGLLGPNIAEQAQKHIAKYPVYAPKTDDLAAIIFTTGSTGPPKGVRYEHDLFSAQRALIHDYYGIKAGDVDQPGFPLFALFSTSLGACAVIPDMDPTKPALVDPVKYIASIEKYGVTYSFGSPAIWNVISNYCMQHEKILPGLQKVLMAGAPVSGELLGRTRKVLTENAQIFTPYGATESLPIVSIESTEVIEETWIQTQQGKGTCVGRPLPGMKIRVIAISDSPIASISETELLATGEIGEIIVTGNVVTKSYDNNEDETTLAKIQDVENERFWHRMGDTGYLDDQGRLWFCGRRAHRVCTSEGVLFSICTEAIVNVHKDVFRAALVGVSDPVTEGKQLPVLIVEKTEASTLNDEELLEQVQQLANESPLTESISRFFVHPGFPVDIRHNAKIFREKLADWAEEKCK